MGRQRIVINLDAPNTGTAPVRAAQRVRGRRWPKVLAILVTIIAVVMVAVAAGGFLFWRYYQSKPAYALSLMLDAAQRDDMAYLEKRLDGEAIARNMTARVSEKAAARYGLALSNKVKSQIDNTMLGLLQELQPAIYNEVTKEIREFASQSEPRPFIFLVIAAPSLMTITAEGDSATASALLDDRRFEIAMRRGADGWKVTDFKDDVVIQRIVDNVMARLPAIGLDSNTPLLKPGKRPARRR